MAKVLYAWELGADYGHVNCFLPFAERLRARGHQVVLAVKDLSRIQALSGAGDFDIVQAPVWLPVVTGLPEPQMCYADILHRFGYLDYNGLLGMVKAWRALYALVEPQLLIADHAPTALLATRGLALPRVLFGSGFYSPPHTSPLPSMRPWLQVPAQRLENSERAALDTINQVLARLGMGSLDRLAQLLAADENILITPEEFDHYSQRGEAHYAGPLISRDGGTAPDWPTAAGPRLFVYVKQNHKYFERLIEQLRESSFCVLVHTPGLSGTRRQALQSSSLRFSPQPVDMRAVCRDAAAVICHAGHGTILRTLLSGLPLLLLPMYLEQTLNARNALRLGAAVAVDTTGEAPDFVALLHELVDKPAYGARARDFARKYADFDQDGMLDSIALRCEELMTDNGHAHASAGTPVSKPQPRHGTTTGEELTG